MSLTVAAWETLPGGASEEVHERSDIERLRKTTDLQTLNMATESMHT